MNREKIKVDRDREKIKVKKKMIDYPRYNRKSRKKNKKYIVKTIIINLATVLNYYK